MPFSPYLAVAAVLALLGAFVAGNLHGHRAEKTVWEAATARLQAEAATTLAAETQRVREAENRAQALTRTIEETHAVTAAADAARGADFDRRLAERVRDAERRARSRCPVPGQAADPAAAEGTASGGDAGLGGISVERVRAIRDAGLELQRYAVACYEWARSVGE